MISEIEQLPSRKTDLNKTRTGVSTPRNVWDKLSNRPELPRDSMTVRRWRLGFVIFYGAAVLLLGGIAATVERVGSLTSAATPTNPEIASADTPRRPH